MIFVIDNNREIFRLQYIQYFIQYLHFHISYFKNDVKVYEYDMKNIDLVRFETIKILNKKCNIYKIFIIISQLILDNKLLLTIIGESLFCCYCCESETLILIEVLDAKLKCELKYPLIHFILISY